MDTFIKKPRKTNQIFLFPIFLFVSFFSHSVIALQPTNLSVCFLEHADQVFLNGYPVNTELHKAIHLNENFQFTEINQQQPLFGWIVPSLKNNTTQTAYRILISSDYDNIMKDVGDMWDSGKTESEESINIRYAGIQLQPNTVYFWKVKTWDNYNQESSFSEIEQFKTAFNLVDLYGYDYSGTTRYPLQKEDIFPVSLISLSERQLLADFGKARFGRIRITLYGTSVTDTVILHLGEELKGGKVNRNPKGSICYESFKIPLMQGWKTYEVVIPTHHYTRMDRIIKMPEYIGEVMPFRYCEVDNYDKNLLKTHHIQQISVHYPFNDEVSYFHSSDSVLNAIWSMCKNTIKSTSFCGVFVDGDRERFPREADSYINQLGYYAVEKGFSIVRYTHEFQICYSSQWTEWILHVVLIAWADYMETGDPASMRYFYNDLKAKTLFRLAREDGLISSKTGLVTSDVIQSVHWHENEWKRQKTSQPAFRDIVDWPQKGGFGGANGETDGFEFMDINTVVNAFHYRTLEIMTKIADILNMPEDVTFFKERAALVKKSLNKKMIDSKTGIYIDGEGSRHSSLHANIFPLVFGLVPEKNKEKVINFIKSRGMACSPYGANYLLESLYQNDESEYALQLLTSTGNRSWRHWIYDLESTMTLEAWDIESKSNLDWNHPWGTAPANIISRKLMGIEPSEPGYSKVLIKPQPGSLKSAEIKLATIRGTIHLSWGNMSNKSFELKVVLPANMKADIYLPLLSGNTGVTINNNPVQYKVSEKYVIIENIGSGEYNMKISTDF